MTVERNARTKGWLSAIVLVAGVIAVDNAVVAENWPSFRNGGTSVAEAVSLPLRWSPRDGVAWRTEIPGYGQSSPVVWNGTVFVTSSDGPWQQHCYVHAYDLKSGAKRWTTEVEGTTRVENYFRNSRAAPTCVVDENIVVSFFASGDVTAMNHAGETQWTRPLFKQYGAVVNERGTASSPAQNREHVFLVIDHDGPSYIVAMRKSDGEIAWKTDRRNRVPSWSSPVFVPRADGDLVVISSADSVDAYDAVSGEPVWQIDGLSGNHIPSVTRSGNSLYVGSTEMFHQSTDVDSVAGSNCRIDLTSDPNGRGYSVRWGAERANSYYSSPLVFAGYVYYVNKAGILYCLDQQTGERKFAKRIGNPCWASAIGVRMADGEELVYLVTKNGFTIVIRPGDEYEQVARNQLWNAEEMFAAAEAARKSREVNSVPSEEAVPKTGPEKVLAGMPEKTLHQMFSYGDPTVYGTAVAGGRLLIRTGQHLYCVGE